MSDPFLRRTGKFLPAVVTFFLLLLLPVSGRAQNQPVPPPFLSGPVWIYNNWSAYDELSDSVPLTEALALREAREIERLRQAGVSFDYYMMDAFWYDPKGGYRSWRKAEWPEGPDRWIEACRAAGLKPGLWFSTNSLTALEPVPAWRNSLTSDGRAMALYGGGFLGDFMDMLQSWYDRGVRMFKLDFADFDAALAGDEARLSPAEIRQRNAGALHDALRDFRRRNPDVVLVAFNGIVGEVESPSLPVSPFNVQWLDVFDSLYSGDPRPSDVPQMDIWRSVDIYSDEMVRHFALTGGLPLSRIDSTAFMIGDTATNYHRRTSAWRGSLLLMAARAGWLNTIHGNLEFLDQEAAHWIATVQRLYTPLQKDGTSRIFGGSPSHAQPYGFASIGSSGALYAAINPAQRTQVIRLPRFTPQQPPNEGGRVLFRDAGYEPILDKDMLRLGPGQIALVGYGEFSHEKHDLGLETDIQIPQAISPLRARFHEIEQPEAGSPLAIETTIIPPSTGDLRILLRLRDDENVPLRAFSTRPMDQIFSIEAKQDGRSLPVESHHGKVIWSGLSWAMGEIRRSDISPGKPIHFRLGVDDHDPDLHLQGQVYRVDY